MRLLVLGCQLGRRDPQSDGFLLSWIDADAGIDEVRTRILLRRIVPLRSPALPDFVASFAHGGARNAYFAGLKEVL